MDVIVEKAREAADLAAELRDILTALLDTVEASRREICP